MAQCDFEVWQSPQALGILDLSQYGGKQMVDDFKTIVQSSKSSIAMKCRALG
jgi:hypothetical protein